MKNPGDRSMTGDNRNPKGRKTPRKKRRLLGVLFSFLSLAALVYIAVTLLSGRDLDIRGLLSVFRSRSPVTAVEEFDFDVGRNRVFTNIGDSLAAAGTFGVQILDIGGNERLRDPFRMTTPAIKTDAGHGIVFDIGGTAVRSFEETRITASIESAGVIISASINRNGWFCVCTSESGAYLSFVTVYDNAGREVYKISLASGYAMSAVISQDNKRIAVLTLAGEGSKITFYELAGETPGGVFDFSDSIILDMRYLVSGKVLAIAQGSLIIVDNGGNGTELYSFGGRRLGGYAIDGSFIALYMLDYSLGYNGRLVTLKDNGELVRELTSDREIISMSSSDGYLAVLQNEGVSFFDTELYELPPDENSISAAGATCVVAIGGSAALAAGEHSAVLIRFERSSSR